MAGEMLGHGLHAAVLEALRVGRAEAAHTGCILAERALAYHGVRRVGVDVEHRGEVHLYAHEAALARHLAAILVEQALVAHGAKAHVAREARGVLDAHREAPLAVEGHEQGHACELLRVVGDGGVLLYGAFAEEQAADAGVDIALGGLAGVGAARVDFGAEELRHALALAQRVVHRVDPALAGAGVGFGHKRGPHGHGSQGGHGKGHGRKDEFQRVFHFITVTRRSPEGLIFLLLRRM